MTTAIDNYVLIIDDEPDIRQLLSITITRMGLTPYNVENIKQAYDALAEKTFALCLTDFNLPDGSGLSIVEYCKEYHPTLPTIVITAHGSMDIAIGAMKAGAFDFINKPIDLKNLRVLINNAISTNQTSQQYTPDMSNIVGEGQTTQQLKQKIIQVSRSQAPILILGESGSGKELVARAIHSNSSRKNEPFIAVNCGAIPKELMENEFFGHLKGSFTGAHQDKTGLFQAAHGGTLLLDEIADLPLDMQVKLLRVIQEKKVRPVGGQTEIPFDVRIISATHKNLMDAVNNGHFRSDLFYRINVIDINVPPLRERKEDIALIAEGLLKKIAQKNKDVKKSLSDESLQQLIRYHFPGNVRELENILERACALTVNDRITQEYLSLSEPQALDALVKNETSWIDKTDTKATPPIGGIKPYDANKESIDQYLENIEREILIKQLEKNRWNRTVTAKSLGITFRSLRYRLKKLGLEIDNT